MRLFTEMWGSSTVLWLVRTGFVNCGFPLLFSSPLISSLCFTSPWLPLPLFCFLLISPFLIFPLHFPPHFLLSSSCFSSPFSLFSVFIHVTSSPFLLLPLVFSSSSSSSCSRFRQICQSIIAHKLFDYVVLAFIFSNCITVALERPKILQGSLVNPSVCVYECVCVCVCLWVCMCLCSCSSCTYCVCILWGWEFNFMM